MAGAGSGSYSSAAKWLHWLVALSVLMVIPVGIAMNGADPGPVQDGLYNLHKSLGVLIFILMVLRIANRLAVGAPPQEPGLAAWQHWVSSAVHWLFYVLLLAMPVIGYVANSAFGATTPFFGLFDLPQIVAKNDALSERLFGLHKLLGFVVAALALLHIAAALQHLMLTRDRVMQRMLPRALGGS